jgi:aspartyl-tRNA(Asn)/glutamyl-tRNA(Gln) amidotransferase subunit C
MNADRNTIQYVANLAAINLNEAEETNFARDLDAIMAHMAQLMRIDTEGVTPMEHVLSLRNALREDRVENGDARAQWLAVAPKTEEDCYLVPSVVE